MSHIATTHLRCGNCIILMLQRMISFFECWISTCCQCCREDHMITSPPWWVCFPKLHHHPRFLTCPVLNIHACNIQEYINTTLRKILIQHCGRTTVTSPDLYAGVAWALQVARQQHGLLQCVGGKCAIGWLMIDASLELHMVLTGGDRDNVLCEWAWGCMGGTQTLGRYSNMGPRASDLSKTKECPIDQTW